MKLNLYSSTAEVSNLYDAQPFGIKPSEHAMELLSAFNDSSTPYMFVINELVANAVDATKDQKDRNIRVHIEDNCIRVQDNGTGMSVEDVKNAVKIFESNRSSSNDYYGAFGIGLKTVFSISDMFFIHTIKDGIAYTWKLEKSPDTLLPVAYLLDQQHTDAANGTEVIVTPTSSHQNELMKITESVKEQIHNKKKKKNNPYPYKYEKWVEDVILPPFSRDIPIQISAQKTEPTEWSDLFPQAITDIPCIKMGSRLLRVKFKDDVENSHIKLYRQLMREYIVQDAQDKGKSIEDYLPYYDIGSIALTPGQTHVEMSAKQYLDSILDPWKHLADQGMQRIKQSWLDHMRSENTSSTKDLAYYVAKHYSANIDDKVINIKYMLRKAQYNWLVIPEQRQQEIVDFLWTHIKDIGSISSSDAMLDWKISPQDYIAFPELHSIVEIPDDLNIVRLLKNNPQAFGYTSNGIAHDIAPNAVVVLLDQNTNGPTMFECSYPIKGYSLDVSNFRDMRTLLAHDGKIPFFVHQETYYKNLESYKNNPLFEDWVAKHLTLKISQNNTPISEIFAPPQNLIHLSSYLAALVTTKGSHKRKEGLSYEVSPMFDMVYSVCEQLSRMYSPEDNDIFINRDLYNPEGSLFYKHIAKRNPTKNILSIKLTKTHALDVYSNLYTNRHVTVHIQNMGGHYQLQTNNTSGDAFHQIISNHLTGNRKKMIEHAVRAQDIWKKFHQNQVHSIEKTLKSTQDSNISVEAFSL